MSSTTHNDCIDLNWVSVPLRPMSGATVLRYWMDPMRDEKAKQIRDLNRLIQGEQPCQCNRCSTST